MSSAAPTVMYTDPAWALTPGCEVDSRLAQLERGILGPGVDLDLGIRNGSGFVTDGSQYLERISRAAAVVIYRAEVTTEVADAMHPMCRVVARQGVGLDNLKAPLLRERGIFGFHVPDYCVDEVSSHALALTLAIERRVCAQDRLVRTGRWAIHGAGIPRRTSELTLGIVGFGRIGRATARKAAAFFRSIVAFDPNVEDDLIAGYGAGSCSCVEELLERSDVVSLHASLNETSRHMIGAPALAHARAGTTVVNTARGRLVEPDAVLAALESGTLGGYAFDVFSPEDPNRTSTGRALLERDDVIATSHCAFLSATSERSLRTRVAREVAHVIATGHPPRSGRVA